MFARIRAISSYLPQLIEDNSKIIDERFIKKIGVQRRHITSKNESASNLAVNAAEKLFSEYSIDRNSADFILLCTQHPDYQMPHTSAQIQHLLGLKKTVGSMDISLGCSGYVYGLAIAKGLIETGLVKKILFITSSVYTKYINPKDKSTRSLFGDGATATWIEVDAEERESLRAFVFGSDGSRFDKLYIPVGGSKFPPRDSLEIFSIDENGNYRSNYEVFMDGMAITYFTLHEIPKLIENVLDLAKLKRSELSYCIFHQANEFIMKFLREKSELTNVPFYNNIRETGNIVSGSIPLAIEQVLKDVETTQLKNVMLVGFGVGLSWAGCIADLTGVFPKESETIAKN